MDYISELPDELSLVVLRFLDPASLLAATQVLITFRSAIFRLIFSVFCIFRDRSSVYCECLSGSVNF